MSAKSPNPSTVYLIPTFLDEGSLQVIPAYVLDAVRDCSVFFTENERSARRYLKAIRKEMIIDQYEWYAIHKAEEELKAAFRQQLRAGKTIGILSEAGCPGVADPGQILVAVAQEEGALVRPLVGPSSILLALMGSGMNGQQFRFCGYLPIDQSERVRALKELENDSRQKNCTQIFIETPYRNNPLMETILKTCKSSTQLCIASNLTAPNESIRTRTVGQWQGHLPDLHKQPAIFCLMAH